MNPNSLRRSGSGGLNGAGWRVTLLGCIPLYPPTPTPHIFSYKNLLKEPSNESGVPCPSALGLSSPYQVPRASGPSPTAYRLVH